VKPLTLLAPLLLTGCLATAPKFPDLPADIALACPELKTTEKNTEEISKLLDTVVQNYGTYYECRVKVDAFIEWHRQQKEVYDKATK